MTVTSFQFLEIYTNYFKSVNLAHGDFLTTVFKLGLHLEFAFRYKLLIYMFLSLKKLN